MLNLTHIFSKHVILYILQKALYLVTYLVNHQTGTLAGKSTCFLTGKYLLIEWNLFLHIFSQSKLIFQSIDQIYDCQYVQ